MKKEAYRYQSVGAEYVGRKINSLILQLLSRRFYLLIFAPPQKSKYTVILCKTLNMLFAQRPKIFLVLVLHQVAPIKVYLRTVI